jgi:hypothetical protein
MIESLWYILFIAAFFIIILVAYMEYDEDFPVFWIIMFLILDSIIWYLIAGAVIEIEIPWQMFNGTSGNIETGVHMFTTKVVYEVSLFCNMMGTLMMIYGAYAVFELFRELYNERTGRPR